MKNKLRAWLRKWLGIDEIDRMAARADLRSQGFDPDDPMLSYKLHLAAMARDPRARSYMVNVGDPQ